MNLAGVRCNPYGYGSDAGPRHLMGGLFGPEYAGDNLMQSDGLHGIGVCMTLANGWYVMECPAGHRGRKMPLCQSHVMMITRRMAQTCTACVMPPESRQLWEDQQACERELRGALDNGDEREAQRIMGKIEDIGRAQVELTRRGLTPRRPMRVVEIS